MIKNAIIGGVGFVGINIATELAKQSKVIVISRGSSIKKRPNITKKLREIGSELVIVDKIDYQSLKGIDADNFIYTIGKLSGDLKTMMDAHVYILNDVIKISKETSSRIIYISSIASIGEAKFEKGSIIYEEENHLDSNLFSQKTPYEISKAEGERLILKNKKELNNKYVILRPSTVFGPYAYEPQWKVVYNLSKRNIKIKIGGENLVYSKDLARIVKLSTEGNFDGKWIYVNWPQKIDIEKVSSYLCNYFKKRRCLTIPLKGLIKIGNYISLPSSPIKMIYRSIKSSYIYKSKYLDQFNFTDFDIAFKDFINWAENNGFNP
ncbi:MAG: NAD-dependent epimerase/dehydratase family protein [Caldisphaera sp.]|uniref:NAD-dependent epimerase/dehydratase family protein n=1 Tax=Caldisphaera sp. TaxID=2060322 RepID=UPI003D10EB37